MPVQVKLGLALTGEVRVNLRQRREARRIEGLAQVRCASLHDRGTSVARVGLPFDITEEWTKDGSVLVHLLVLDLSHPVRKTVISTDVCLIPSRIRVDIRLVQGRHCELGHSE